MLVLAVFLQRYVLRNAERIIINVGIRKRYGSMKRLKDLKYKNMLSTGRKEDFAKDWFPACFLI